MRPTRIYAISVIYRYSHRAYYLFRPIERGSVKNKGTSLQNDVDKLYININAIDCSDIVLRHMLHIMVQNERVLLC